MDDNGPALRCPYPGQRPYRPAESASFFGRDRESAEVAKLWADNRLTILCGRAGVGKSSLLQAGIVPLVDLPGVDVLPVGRVSGSAEGAVFPAVGLAPRNRFSLALLSAWARAEAPTRLSRISLSEFLAHREQGKDKQATLIAVDQVEELFENATGNSTASADFLTELADALRQYQQAHLLLVLRTEYLPALLAESPLVPDAIATLSALEPRAAVEVIRRPLAAAGLAVSAGTADSLVIRLTDPPEAGQDDRALGVNEGQVEPALLQAVGECLWQRRAAGPIDVEQCLAQFVTTSAAAAAYECELLPGQLLDWLNRTFVVAGASTVTASEQGRSGEQGGGNEQGRGGGQRAGVLRALQDRHLLRAVAGARQETFALLSEHLRTAIQLSLTYGPVRWTAPGPGDHLAAASRALAAGDSGRAQRLARLALDLATADDLRVRAQATTLLGNAALSTGSLSTGSLETALSRYRAAADLYEALQDHVNVGYLLGAIGRLYLLDQDPAAAVVALASATARLRADGVIMLDLARAFANSGETYAAIAVLGSALTADPDVGAEDVHLLRAELLADLGDPVGALRDLGQPSPYQSLSAAAARALSMARLGRFEDAEENIGRALVAGRDNGPVLLRAAQIRALRGDSQGAESLLREALEASDPRLSQYELLQADSLKESCGV